MLRGPVTVTAEEEVAVYRADSWYVMEEQTARD